jgi:hypothetical protein
VPDVSKFDHAARVKPYNVGDQVQLTSQTGNVEQRVEGQPHTPQERVDFGRITAYDGKGNWTVQEMNRDGSLKKGADGKPVTRSMTDQDLRRTNNPNMLRDGDKVHSDTRFDSQDPNQQRMMQDWHASKEYRDLQARKPGANATPAQRAGWERDAVSAAERFVGSNLRYPSASEQERTGMRTKIGDIDRQIADPANQGRVADLQRQRASAQAELDQAERDNRERTRLDGEVRRLEGDLATAQRDGKSTETIQRELDQARTDRTRTQERIDQDTRYHQELQNGRDPPPSIGDYYANRTGQCRHQAIAMQSLMQDMGIDSRMTRGAANDDANKYRGEHMWLEATLSNGQQLLVDPTWNTVTPLRETYQGSPTRREVPRETERQWPSGYRDSVTFNEWGPYREALAA